MAKWKQITGIALSLPTTLIVTGIGMKMAIERGIISKMLGVIIFLAIIVHTILLILIYAYKKKN